MARVDQTLDTIAEMGAVQREMGTVQTEMQRKTMDSLLALGEQAQEKIEEMAEMQKKVDTIQMKIETMKTL
eukprot:11175222-Karenia_brevis.AAC.1